MAATSATVSKRQLGAALRRLREGLGMDRDVPAGLLECSPSKLTKIEAGDVGVKASELRDLLALYRVSGRARDDLLTLGTQSRQRRRRTSYGGAIPDWFRKYVNLEEVATEFRSYSTELIPGLLQTEDYARALTQASPLPPPGDVDRLVEARMARQVRLTGQDPVTVHALLSEGALHTQVGRGPVMRAQLGRLLELAKLSTVTIQVCLFEMGAHAATGFPFVLLRLPNSDGLDVVYLEDHTSARYIDNDPQEQQKYGVVWSFLTKHALTPAASVRLIDTIRGKS